MANSNISSIGRFSSQMLTYLGTQRTVKGGINSSSNTYKYATGVTVSPNPGSASQAGLGLGVTGSYSAVSYNTTKCYFLSRGASEVYADTMTALVIDMALMTGVSPQRLLELSTSGKTLKFSEDAYRSMNLLRDPGNQVGTATDVSNKTSLISKEIRS